MDGIAKKLPTDCPACGSTLSVKRLHCQHCGTEVEGLFDLPALVKLSADEQRFILDFVRSSGSLKQMAKLLNRSYPSVRNYLDDLIRKLEEPSQP